jgi:glucose dehydrogenase
VSRTIECDVCVIGGGITAAMVAERLTESRDAKVVVIEAGNRLFNLEERFARRERFLRYGENPWPDDHVQGQTGKGIQSRTMAVGGLALHWGGTTPRFTPEDLRLRSLYGVYEDWPIAWEDLEPFYQEAEERIGVAGVAGPAPYDPRSSDYPMPALPLSYNLERLRAWAERSGIPFWPNPVAKNSQPYRGRNVCTRCDTCTICPTGARYSPDFTYQQLLAEKRIELHDRTLVRRLELEPSGDRVQVAVATHRDQPDQSVRYRARWFVLAAGYAWSSHLMLLSANDRWPSGLGNRDDLVGRFVSGHRPVNAFAEVPEPLFPGIYQMDSLLSKRYQHDAEPVTRTGGYSRFDLRIWETSYGREPRLRDDAGDLLLGSALLDDWRRRATRGAARLRAYYDVLPSPESRLTLDPSRRNEHGDPMLRIDFADAPESAAARPQTEAKIRGLFERIVASGGGKLLRVDAAEVHDHPAGGLRMGRDAASGVVDPWGRSFHHDNLWVAGAPTMPSAGCNNGTLTFVALSLRTAAKLAEALPASTAGGERS